MGTIVVRPVEGEELLDTAFTLTAYAFAPSPQPPDRAALQRRLPALFEGRYCLVLFEDGRPMATGNTIPMTQTIRGASFGMGGVAAVATHPLARRQGHARRIMQGLFEQMRATGRVVSCLHPFRPSFYGRLGYVSFPPRRIVQIGPASLAPLLRQDLGGTVSLLPLSEGFDAYRAFLEELRPTIHGMALRPAALAAASLDQHQRWLALATVDGATAGVLTYRLTGEPTEMRVDSFFARDSQGKYLLLQWLARHADQVRHAWIELPPDDFPETWSDDPDVRIHSAYSLHGYYEPMGRVVDVAGLAGLTTVAGRFTARVVDDHCPWNTGTYVFETVAGRLTVNPAAAADCELTIHALAALVYGGPDPADFVFRGWGNPSPAAQAVMRRMFPRRLPFLHESF